MRQGRQTTQTLQFLTLRTLTSTAALSVQSLGILSRISSDAHDNTRQKNLQAETEYEHHPIERVNMGYDRGAVGVSVRDKLARMFARDGEDKGTCFVQGLKKSEISLHQMRTDDRLDEREYYGVAHPDAVDNPCLLEQFCLITRCHDRIARGRSDAFRDLLLACDEVRGEEISEDVEQSADANHDPGDMHVFGADRGQQCRDESAEAPTEDFRKRVALPSSHDFAQAIRTDGRRPPYFIEVKVTRMRGSNSARRFGCLDDPAR